MMGQNEKDRLYWLIEQYLSNKVDAWKFCNEFFTLYNINLDLNKLSVFELSVFDKLDDIVSRYTNVKEDLIKYPNAYYNDKTLKQIVLETKLILEKENSK